MNVISTPPTASDDVCIASGEAGDSALESHFRVCLPGAVTTVLGQVT